MVHNSTLFTLKILSVCASLLESLVMTRVVCHDSSHSLTRVESTCGRVRVKSESFTGDSSQVKSFR